MSAPNEPPPAPREPAACCELLLPEPFDLRQLVFSHGWAKLAPFHWDEARGVLAHGLHCATGRVVWWTAEQPARHRLRLTFAAARPLAASEVTEALAGIRWALRVEESFAGFHALCRQYGPLRAAAAEGRGRLLRSPTLWEDLAKTICTTCTTWARTKQMVAALCQCWGAPGPREGQRAFPTPAVLATVPEADLRQAAGLGYRARPLKALAEAVAGGTLDLEALRQEEAPADERFRTLQQLPGIGPYGAAHLLMLLGCYEHLAIDAWVRRVVSRGWFRGQPVTDAEIRAAFARFGKWQALVYWFWDWDGAAEEWSWREE